MLASSIQLGLIDFEPGTGLLDKDDPVLFVDLIGAGTLIFDEILLMPSFTSTGDKAGFFDFGLLGFAANALTNLFAIRETNHHIAVSFLTGFPPVNGENGVNGVNGVPPTPLNLAEGLPDQPAKIKDRVFLEPFALRPMERLAIYMRSLRPDELRATVEGRVLYNDTPSQAGPPPKVHQAATNRYRRASVLEVLRRYVALFLPGVPVEEIDRLAEENQGPHIRATIAAAWDRYDSLVEGPPDAAGFRSYLESTPDEEECLAYINGLRGLFNEVRIMGATSRELRVCKNHVLEPITPENIGQDQLEQTIEIGSVG